jgi:hypothetical protein
MSTQTTAPSAKLINWVKERTVLIEQLTREINETQHRGEDDKSWTLRLLTEFANVEQVARRAVHLLTVHALRDQVANATEVAQASNVTITGAINRAGSKLGQEVWNELEAMPEKKRT